MKRMMKAHTLRKLDGSFRSKLRASYRQMTLKRMTQWKLKMFAMPNAKQRMMQMTPVLWRESIGIHCILEVSDWRLRIPLAVYTCAVSRSAHVLTAS